MTGVPSDSEQPQAETTVEGEQADPQSGTRAVRRPAVVAIAAFVLIAGGIIAWRVIDRETGPSTTPVLEWTEFDPGFDSDHVGFLESPGDGRVMVTITDYDDTGWIVAKTRLLVTANGVDWTEIPVPDGIALYARDLSGDRWLVAGYDFAFERPPPANVPGMDDDGDEEAEVENWALPKQRIFFSDDRGASWTELEINPSSDQVDAPSDPDRLPIISAALVSGDHMVIVLQSENPETVVVSEPSEETGGWEAITEENPLARIFVSDGGAFEQVAAYEGWILGYPFTGSFSTPNGFTLSLQRMVDGRHQLSDLTSPDGRNWSEVPVPEPWPMRWKAVGPDGSLWGTAWVGNELRLQRTDQDGTQTITGTLENFTPMSLTGGPSGLAIGATDTIVPTGRVAKDGYELRANEPEGGMTLWDLSADTAVYEFGLETFLSGLPEGVREIEQPVDDEHMDAVVLVFEDPETGADLVSFTREDLLSIDPVGDDYQPEMWVGWSADGVDWGWQTLADAFGSEGFRPDDAWVQLAVGDGFVLARVEVFPESSSSPSDGDYPGPEARWFIARVP